jgi:hypothetical protein
MCVVHSLFISWHPADRFRLGLFISPFNPSNALALRSHLPFEFGPTGQIQVSLAGYLQEKMGERRAVTPSSRGADPILHSSLPLEHGGTASLTQYPGLWNALTVGMCSALHHSPVGNMCCHLCGTEADTSIAAFSQPLCCRYRRSSPNEMWMAFIGHFSNPRHSHSSLPGLLGSMGGACSGNSRHQSMMKSIEQYGFRST